MTDKKLTNIIHNKSGEHLQFGFTIIEVIVVIVIIGILSSIAFVSYNGIQAKARDNSVLSDLENMDAAQTKYGLDHNVSGLEYYSGNGESVELDFKASEGNVIDVVLYGDEYCIRGYNTNSSKKSINDSFIKESIVGTCNLIGPSIAAGGVATVVIGTDPIQVWMAENLNEGDMLTPSVAMSDNSIVEKYCYDNNQANCTQYGGLYTLEETLQYGSNGEQGICPSGFSVPSDDDWKVLETNLGMPTDDLDNTGWLRGYEEGVGTKLKVGGSSGFEAELGGFYTFGDFQYLGVGGYWTRSGIIHRIIEGPEIATYVGRFDNNIMGYGDYRSVRCIKS